MTKIFAHRGSSINRPENTLIAFEEALRVGADGIELDVQLSKDGQIMVIHDRTVDRTTNGRGRVSDQTRLELQRLDAGSWFDPKYANQTIPTLKEVLAYLANKTFDGCLNIEIKSLHKSCKGIEKELHKLVSSQKWPFDIVYSSFNLLSLYRLYRLDKTAKIAYIGSRSSIILTLSNLLPIFSALHLSQKIYFSNKRHLNKPIRLWTVNDEKQMAQVLRHGVSGMFTDKPEIALQLRDRLQDQHL